MMVEESDKVAHHKEVPKVSFLELLKLNIPDWPLVLTGVIGSAIMGALFPLLAILFGGLLAVSVLHTLPSLHTHLVIHYSGVWAL